MQASLAVLLSHRAPGQPVLRSEVQALTSTAGSVVRTCAVHAELGLLVDDRPDPVETLVASRTAGLPESFARDVAGWMRVLAHGNARRPARSGKTLAEYSRCARRVLLSWAVRVDTLREVTPAMVTAALANPPAGVRTANLFTALRSLFGHLRRTGRVFTDPTHAIHLGAQPLAPILPLSTGDYARVVASATSPAARLVDVLAGVHAARPPQIRALRLVDAGVWQHRLAVAGNPRRMDDLTRAALLDWLLQRRTTWPRTANPHLLITGDSAVTCTSERDLASCAISLDAADPAVEAAFWREFLGLEVIWENDDFVALRGAPVLVTVQRIADHRAFEWPGGDVPKQMHVEIAVTDLDGAEQTAVELGAIRAAEHPEPERWRVLLDPAGHPFCISNQIPEP